MKPIVISSNGNFQLAHGAIRVGTAVQPYHAVTLAQVKKMLSTITVANSGNIFRINDTWTLYDKAIGFCLSEPGVQEPLNYVYTGKIVDVAMILTSTAIAPPVTPVIRDVITAIDVFNPYILSELDYTACEQWNYVYTGKVVDRFKIIGLPVTTTVVKVTESVTLLAASLSYALEEKNWTDGNLAYVYTGTGVDVINVEETFITATTTIATDVIAVSEINHSDVVFTATTEEPTVYPDNGLVLQKTKPVVPGETRALGDRAIIKLKYKVTDNPNISDAAFGCCLSDTYVPEPFERMLFAKVTDRIAAGSQTAKSTLEVV
jgi:hypothetical protein